MRKVDSAQSSSACKHRTFQKYGRADAPPLSLLTQRRATTPGMAPLRGRTNSEPLLAAQVGKEFVLLSAAKFERFVSAAPLRAG